ncbi:MAG: lytic transglycosylase domain-containing protein [Deltaproteobacteria bacterium]|nr:lytic transglycosylase domain-containing protein [Deltaproteobacteria bacterium]
MLLIFISCLILTGNAFAIDGFYSYVDKKGVLHVTNIPSDLRFTPHGEPEKRPALSSQRMKKIITLVERAARKYSVDPHLVKAVIRAESDFNPYAVSRAGAKGLMQLMPETADALDVINPFDPYESIEGGVRYLRYLLNLFENDLKLSLAAYNAGRTNVIKYGGIPPFKETRNYVRKVLVYYDEYRKM